MRAVLLSFVVHAAVLAAAWTWVVPTARRGPVVRTRLVINRALPVVDPEPPFAEPEPPTRPSPVDERILEDDKEEEEREFEFDVPTAPYVTRSVHAVALTIRVRSRPQPAPVKKAVAPMARTAPAPRKPRGVSRGPVATGQTAPVYPAKARRFAWEGRVLLRVLIDVRGHVERVEVVESSSHACLDRAAVRAARTWRFEPALRDGHPVATWFTRAVRFKLSPSG